MELRNIGSNQTEVQTDKARVLYSYSTPVAAYVIGRGYLRTEAYYSRTTSKHINQWIAGATATVVSQADIDKLIG